ncbi:uncharacterized protein METZ01_LOCUS256366 [marine metagenome]|uniref:Uncharacterized protein n=1 Tax=marine metagenome TaxID=408172 RepID=A0A382IWH5_9ZZZZ
MKYVHNKENPGSKDLRVRTVSKTVLAGSGSL